MLRLVAGISCAAIAVALLGYAHLSQLMDDHIEKGVAVRSTNDVRTLVSSQGNFPKTPTVQTVIIAEDDDATSPSVSLTDVSLESGRALAPDGGAVGGGVIVERFVADSDPNASDLVLPASGTADSSAAKPDQQNAEHVDQHGEHSIRGKVVSETGLIVADASITLRQFDEEVVGKFTSFTRTIRGDGQGKFEFSGIQAGRYRVSVVGQAGYAGAAKLIDHQTPFVELVANSLAQSKVLGLVRDAHFSMVEGVAVTLSPTGVTTETDADGRYIIQAAIEKNRIYHLTFEMDGYRRAVVPLYGRELAASNGGSRIDTTLAYVDGQTELYGQLVDVTGLPVAGETVSLSSTKLNQRYETRSDASGQFQFEDVVVGSDYLLGVSPRKHYAALRHPIQIKFGVPPVTLQLEEIATGSIAGRLVNAGGEPYRNYELEAVALSAANNRQRLRTDENGEFYIDRIGVGTVLLENSKEPRLSVSGLSVVPGRTREVTLQLDDGDAALQVVIVSESGHPVAAASATLATGKKISRITSQTIRKARTNVQGLTEFQRLGLGQHHLSIIADGYKPTSLRLKLTDKRETTKVILKKNNSNS